jgi:protein SCO1
MNSQLPQYRASHLPINRRKAIAAGSMVAASALFAGCSKKPPVYHSVDLTGADFAKDFSLKDHLGNLRNVASFKGKIVVIFFGFVQCPDVCPTSMATMADVKKILGNQGANVQVLFVTVDPERDKPPVLAEYMKNFDPEFLALVPTPEELKKTAEHFKIYYKQVPGKTATSYTMDHTAGKYIFDTQGRLRLYAKYGSTAEQIAADIKLLADHL